MAWNWQLPNWPKFRYDPSEISTSEKDFLMGAGSCSAYLKTITVDEHDQFVVEILSLEGLKSSLIEGELLKQESLQSSIQLHFHLKKDAKKLPDKEYGMGELLCTVYRTYDEPLTHEMLGEWHHMLLFKGSTHVESGSYRTNEMHIVSGRVNDRTIHFEAPPAKDVPREMTNFIEWYNASRSYILPLARAAVAHLYFETIHPFEDGNGRIGRILVEKALSQCIGRPTLIAVSEFIEQHRKEYYAELGRANKSLDIQHWVVYFARVILQAQEGSLRLLQFLIQKSKMLTKLSGHINHRQEKALIRMFTEGPDGFTGGMRSANYQAITKAPSATATRDLADLVTQGALKKSGERRHARYWLNIQT